MPRHASEPVRPGGSAKGRRKFRDALQANRSGRMRKTAAGNPLEMEQEMKKGRDIQFI
jgi:hypothetical protein